MNREDRRRWAAAGTLGDLGELTALWLEGRIGYHPGYGVESDRGPDPETLPLVPVLARLNRAGFLTETSQPGEPPHPGYDGRYWQQRAAVGGFVNDSTLDRLDAAVKDTGLLLVVHETEIPPWWWRWLPRRWRPELAWGWDAVPVTAATDGTDHTWFGGMMNYDDVSCCFYGRIGAEAFRGIIDAWQVTVIDPEWGRNELLWEVLTERFLCPPGVA